MANPYKDEKGHFTNKENDGGECHHKLRINKGQHQIKIGDGDWEDVSEEEWLEAREGGYQEFDETTDDDFGFDEEENILDEYGLVKDEATLKEAGNLLMNKFGGLPEVDSMSNDKFNEYANFLKEKYNIDEEDAKDMLVQVDKYVSENSEGLSQAGYGEALALDDKKADEDIQAKSLRTYEAMKKDFLGYKRMTPGLRDDFTQDVIDNDYLTKEHKRKLINLLNGIDDEVDRADIEGDNLYDINNPENIPYTGGNDEKKTEKPSFNYKNKSIDELDKEGFEGWHNVLINNLKESKYDTPEEARSKINPNWTEQQKAYVNAYIDQVFGVDEDKEQTTYAKTFKKLTGKDLNKPIKDITMDDFNSDDDYFEWVRSLSNEGLKNHLSFKKENTNKQTGTETFNNLKKYVNDLSDDEKEMLRDLLKYPRK